MFFQTNDINRNKLTHLIADDLFTEGMQQVFCAKTGKFKGYLYNDQEYLLPDEDETEQENLPLKNENQLSLF